MRVLLLMRGAPGCGKSTYIDKNGLRPYALSADEIRLMCQSSQMTAYGSEEISMANDKTVWNMLFKMLEVRMQNNDLEFKKYSYDEMCRIADTFGLTHKEKAFVLEDWGSFFDWYNEILVEDYLYNGREIEGFVIEDSNGFMTKLKLTYYNFWKFMRSLTPEILKSGNTRKTSALTTATANQYYGYVKYLYQTVEDKKTIPKDIVTLRKMFYRYMEKENQINKKIFTEK